MWEIALALVALLLVVVVWTRSKIVPGVGFFHPFRYDADVDKCCRAASRCADSDAGGGGERVLWTMIDILRRRMPGLTLDLFTGLSCGSVAELNSLVNVDGWSCLTSRYPC
jgi:hypothetical protein